ncbi:polyhydroxyalkanoate synthesis regulator DNA-binding domain-containing protein [Desulfonema magnum]|uniref:PHB/PHA accumulation regulator DNA-binding domain-containing protein n=1 Tax=Desulfonema magnum TaxID=45655 RepID=A0A975GPD4_9BACT|nr:polyhydroxyalkanoate synthesis regulator DNA-binding domain-containing protein [Desulfonema magnum]QTA88724.1 PHB/PHA accumulation regulator DNA-binding domain-containing protein [Desulfonema magnum]
MSHKLTIKKYPNRRLYDTENSSYVTLADVADIIRQQGRQVKVVDVKSNEDVTAFILTQIIMEQVKKKSRILPVSLLHLIIRSGEDVLSEFFENYLEKAIESYLTYKKTMDEQFKICLELGMDFSNMAKKTMKDITPFGSFFDSASDETDKNKKA